ncbi:MAG: SDR family NAD(P)-dependent oxidoreductase, partial [Candidatus Hydrogenedentes bacterium]|nr:SDR family NAD(P)-dependent oxidoreductase [Candidatus Hydrogenedentota bacterium]
MNYEILGGKTAVVTGASRGIGQHIARALALAGAQVAITGRDAGTLQDAARIIGQTCRWFVCDQRDPEAIVRAGASIISEMGVPDILVNNAGIMLFESVVDMSVEKWNEVIETNLTGSFLMTKVFL